MSDSNDTIRFKPGPASTLLMRQLGAARQQMEAAMTLAEQLEGPDGETIRTRAEIALDDIQAVIDGMEVRYPKFAIEARDIGEPDD